MTTFAILLAMALLGAAPAAGAEGASLVTAVAAGDLPTAKRLIAAGADLEARNGSGETALLAAVRGNRVEIARALIDAGADINARAGNRDTPFLLAGASGRTEIIAAMIPAGPDLTLFNRFGGTALIPACERAHVETIALLLTTAIDVDHVNALGWTCLLEIVILGDGGPRHVEITRLVLAAGARPDIADKEGVSPLAHARAKGQREVAALIVGAGGR